MCTKQQTYSDRTDFRENTMGTLVQHPLRRANPATPPLRLLERRPSLVQATVVAPSGPGMLERFEAWLDGLQMPAHHRMGSWTVRR